MLADAGLGLMTGMHVCHAKHGTNRKSWPVQHAAGLNPARYCPADQACWGCWAAQWAAGLAAREGSDPQSLHAKADGRGSAQLEVCDSPAGCLGLTTCYDVRFPEVFQRLVFDMGARVLTVPSAFTKATGAVHGYALQLLSLCSQPGYKAQIAVQRRSWWEWRVALFALMK